MGLFSKTSKDDVNYSSAAANKKADAFFKLRQAQERADQRAAAAKKGGK